MSPEAGRTDDIFQPSLVNPNAMKNILVTTLIFGLATSLSAQLVTLKQVGAADVSVPFTIEVWVENSIVPPGSELLSFAFDVDTSANLALLAATVGGDFFDDFGLTPHDVAGSAFPAFIGPDVMLASLEVLGSAPGPAFLSVLGPVDIFGGLKYLSFDDPFAGPVNLDYPIEASIRLDLVIPDPSIPEPSRAPLLSLLLMVGWLVSRRSR